MEKILVISCSLNPESKSRILAKAVHQKLKGFDTSVEYIDLQNYQLPHCDGNACYGDKNVQELTTKISEAHGIVLAVPVYNYAMSSSAKNLIELTGKAWTDKVVGFVCAAGGNNSYMAPMGLGNSLMLDFRCVIVPRFVYATGAAFQGSNITDEKIQERINGLCDELVKISVALNKD